MNRVVLAKILEAWFDDGAFLVSEKDEDTLYVGFHHGRTSEVVTNTERKDALTVYQIDKGGSYLNAFHSEFPDGSDHSENLELIGMTGSRHDFKFEQVRNYSECHTTITMIK